MLQKKNTEFQPSMFKFTAINNKYSTSLLACDST